MRVVLTCNFSPWASYSGGGQRSTHELASALTRLGHDTSVIFTRPPWEKYAVPETRYRVHFASFFDYKSRRQAPLRPLNAVSVSRWVAKLHRANPVDVVHGNGEEVALAARWAQARGIAVITTPRYPNYPEPMLAAQGLDTFAKLRLLITDAKYLALGAAVKHSTLCCPTSDYTKQQIIRALGADPVSVRVVPNGVAPAFLKYQWQPSERVRPIVFFGRLEHDKGLDTLLQALPKLGTPSRLVVAGRGHASEDFRQLAASLGLEQRIDWHPWLSEDELARTLANSVLAVLPSRHESFGNAMAEAMAVGTPLVSTEAGSIPELVKHEATGLLVPAESPEPLVQAMQRLLDDPVLCQSLSLAARAHIREHYTWDKVAERYAELYRWCISRPAPSCSSSTS